MCLKIEFKNERTKWDLIIYKQKYFSSGTQKKEKESLQLQASKK